MDGHNHENMWKNIIAFIVSFIENYASELPSTSPIIFSFPGPVARPAPLIGAAPAVVDTTLNLHSIVTELSSQTNRTVHLINDMTAAAWHISRQIIDNRFIVVTVSSGIGSKIFDRKHSQYVIDNPSYSGEIGHTIIDFSSEAILCDCGGKGHLTTVSSGRGIERYAKQLAQRNPNLFMKSACVKKFGADANTLSNENHIVPSALLLDTWALNIIQECTVPLARTLMTIILAVGLERVVIIGGFALKLGEIYIDILRSELLRASDFPIMKDRIKNLLILGNSEEEACLEGAAVYGERLSNVRKT